MTVNYGRLLAGDPRHGQRNAYANFGCRCEPCRVAQRAYQRDLVARTKAAARRT